MRAACRTRRAGDKEQALAASDWANVECRGALLLLLCRRLPERHTDRLMTDRRLPCQNSPYRQQSAYHIPLQGLIFADCPDDYDFHTLQYRNRVTNANPKPPRFLRSGVHATFPVFLSAPPASSPKTFFTKVCEIFVRSQSDDMEQTITQTMWSRLVTRSLSTSAVDSTAWPGEGICHATRALKRWKSISQEPWHSVLTF